MLIEHEPNRDAHLTLDPTMYLGPARVRAVAGNRLQLEFPDELPWAVLALAFPYQPSEGDIVLAAGQGANWYVIGLLEGTGKTKLILPGDFEVLAPRGHISLVAGKSIEIKGPGVKITAGKLVLAAQQVIERFTEATRWIKETWQIRAGRVRTQVEGDYQVKAKRINERAEEDVKIDGNKIHLG